MSTAKFEKCIERTTMRTHDFKIPLKFPLIYKITRDTFDSDSYMVNKLREKEYDNANRKSKLEIIDNIPLVSIPHIVELTDNEILDCCQYYTMTLDGTRYLNECDYESIQDLFPQIIYRRNPNFRPNSEGSKEVFLDRFLRLSGYSRDNLQDRFNNLLILSKLSSNWES